VTDSVAELKSRVGRGVCVVKSAPGADTERHPLRQFKPCVTGHEHSWNRIRVDGPIENAMTVTL
jgi:hypothetical protein